MSVAAFLANLDPAAPVRTLRGGPATAEAFFDLCRRQPDTPWKLAVHRDPDTGAAICHFVDQVSHARIFIDLDAGRVDKLVHAHAIHGILQREAGWLRALDGSGRTPRLLDQGPDRLGMTYLGEPLRQHNLPADWRDQAQAILAALDRAGCCHNDIKCDNLVVRDGRLGLIDFGFSTRRRAPIPAEWPEPLGRQHRLAVHRFDDRHAIHAACAQAAAGRVDLSRRVAG